MFHYIVFLQQVPPQAFYTILKSLKIFLFIIWLATCILYMTFGERV